MNFIQTCGSYTPNDGYSVCISFNEFHTITLDGLTKDDMLELKSCIECMIFEELTEEEDYYEGEI